MEEPPTENSVELLARARAGDREALDRLYGRYLGPLQRWARGRLPGWARDRLDTDDLVQETLLRTFRRVDDFRPRHDGAFAGYLRQVLQNRIREELRRTRRRPVRDTIDSGKIRDESPSVLEQIAGREALDRYEVAVLELRPEDRELIVLRIELGKSYAEIAEAVGKPSPNAARMAITRALMRLAERIARA